MKTIRIRSWAPWVVSSLLGVVITSGCCVRMKHEPNKLSAWERQAGYELLFDGQSTRGWRAFGKPGFPEQGWVVEDGWLHHRAGAGGGDIITGEKFENFVLEFEWRIAKAGNSGVKYFISEQRGAPIGHEYQVIDDAAHPDASHGPKRQTAALYDALPPVDPAVRPAGSINHSRIVVNGDDVEHWLNGRLALRYRVGSPEMVAAKAASKFKNEALWGTRFPTPILIQDHHDEVWYRDIRIRRLPRKP